MNYSPNIFFVLLLVLIARGGGIFAQDTSIRSKLQNLDLLLIEIQTVNNEEPTYEEVEAPSGSWSISIKNATKVPGRLLIYQKGILIYDSGEYIKGKSGITIKVRGNTSAYMDMKPYKIKLQQKADLLFRENENKYADKDFLLLIDDNFYKKIGFKVNEMAGLQWTPSYEYANLIINGDYKGLYMLTESVSRNQSCRLDVEKTGFIFEYDPYWWNEDVFVNSPTLPWPMHYTFKYPDSEDITVEQLSYFESFITLLEHSLEDGTYPNYIDVESFVSWILGHDLLGNSDGGGSNYYLTKKDNTDSSKVMMANMWDFDGVFETEDKWDRAHDLFYFPQLFNNDNKTFVNAYVSKWNELSQAFLNDILEYLNNFVQSTNVDDIDESILLTNQRWSKNAKLVQLSVENAKRWFESRHIWLTKAIYDLGVSSNILLPNNATRCFESENSYYSILGYQAKMPQKGIHINRGKKVIYK